MNSYIGVTGATGAVGGATAQLLADAGVRQRLLVRRPAASPRLPGAVTVQSRYADDDDVRASLRGVDVLLLVSAHEAEDRLRQHLEIVDAAQKAGVRHIVYTSFQAAASDAVFTLAREHAATEEHIRRTGLAFTFLRDSYYLDSLGELCGADGIIRGPAGAGRVAAVARADVARTAAAVLLQPDLHNGATYTLTGPKALSMTDIASALTRVHGSHIRYHPEGLEEAYRSRAHYKAPAWEVDAWVSTYTAIASGAMAEVTNDVETVTGRLPISFDELLGRSDPI